MKPDYAFLPAPSSHGNCHVIAKRWHINGAPLQGSFLLMSLHKTIRWLEEGHGGIHLAPPHQGRAGRKSIQVCWRDKLTYFAKTTYSSRHPINELRPPVCSLRPGSFESRTAPAPPATQLCPTVIFVFVFVLHEELRVHAEDLGGDYVLLHFF